MAILFGTLFGLWLIGGVIYLIVGITKDQKEANKNVEMDVLGREIADIERQIVQLPPRAHLATPRSSLSLSLERTLSGDTLAPPPYEHTPPYEP